VTWSYAFDAPPGTGEGSLDGLLGGKGANLVVMSTTLALPVPPGFIITTEACRAVRSGGWPAGLDEELRERMARVGAAVGRRFGDPSDPLLVSVRSGAPVSMPGMLDTILNVGLNAATTPGLARAAGDEAFAGSCRARLESMYRDIVGAAVVPEDPWQQLREAIEAVFRSWDSPRARAYRDREGINHELGTAVVVQAMVFGNRSPDSGTGVLFTRDPATGARTLYGDVLFGAQGEDVVAGRHVTQPVSVLDERLPEVAERLRAYAELLERHHADICDIEFTIEDGRLWLLQNRVGKRSAQAALRAAVEMAEDPAFPLSRSRAVERVAHLLADPPMTIALGNASAPVVATGLPASPGVTSGAIATSPASALAMAEAGRAVILVRTATSPDDVHGMSRAAGILTTTGGLASHAAVVARGWDIPAVVGATGVQVEDGLVRIGQLELREGDVLSIDGSTGEVFGGAVEGVPTVVPEAATLLAWAADLGVEVRMPRGGGIAMDARETVAGAAGASEATGDDIIRALLIKGYVTPELLAPAIRVAPDQAEAQLDRLVADGVAELTGGMFRLTGDGRALAEERLAADREAWGAAPAQAALDGFLGLDGRMKLIVTAWQMREVDGQQVLNDHADAEHDAAVLADLAALHADAMGWLTPHVAGLPRLSTYAARLEAATGRVREREHAYIASPRVDSYHGIWFELHEDLIRLAGRTREEEVAAGRA
jgi:pyruvate, orthophosphate dikinase